MKDTRNTKVYEKYSWKISISYSQNYFNMQH